MTFSPKEKQHKIETLLLEEFRAVPFHNLFYIGLVQPSHSSGGSGTCSDKTLAFQTKLASHNIQSRLHSGFIQGQETHRLLSIEIGNNTFFADVGNGWPSIRLFPAHENFAYSAFGIRFEGVVNHRQLAVYPHKNGQKSLSLSIPFKFRSEQSILEDIKQRFSGQIQYPFGMGIRFAQVVKDQFLFIKNDSLRIFSEGLPVQTILLADNKAALAAIEHYFAIDLASLGTNENNLNREGLVSYERY